MGKEFWAAAWQAGRTGFHKAQVHPMLETHLDALTKGEPACVLVPLCGKSLDLRWLVAQGHEVVGVELVAQAVEQLFADGASSPVRGTRGTYESWQEPGLCVLHGDVFALEAALLPRPVTGVWDRASLVALPPNRRREYVDVLRRVVMPGGRILLNVFEYDSAIMDGPPFSVSEAEVRQLYSDCGLQMLERTDGSAMFADDPKRKGARFDIVTWLIELPGRARLP